VKLTVITGPKAKLVAIVHAHISEHDRNRSHNEPHATLRPGPGQKFHEIEAPQEYEGLPREELRRWVLKHLPGKKRTTKKRK
jgi:hypothetical protein